MPLSPPTSANPTKSSPAAPRCSTRILFPPSKSAWVALSKTSWINHDKNHRFPAEIISHAVWWYFRFCLSYRDVDRVVVRALSPSLVGGQISPIPRGVPKTIMLRRPTEDSTIASKCSQRPTLYANVADVPIQLTMPADVMLSPAFIPPE